MAAISAGSGVGLGAGAAGEVLVAGLAEALGAGDAAAMGSDEHAAAAQVRITAIRSLPTFTAETD